MRRSSLALRLAVASAAAFTAAGARADAPLLSLSAFSQLKLHVDDAGDEPINGFTPQMIFTLTDEQNHGDSVEGFGVASSSPGGSFLPNSDAPHYAIATLDSGSQADIISFDDANLFDFAGAHRDGSNTQTVEGANGTEDLTISDAIGIYATDFSNATVSGGKISGVTPGSLKGQWDVPVLLGNQGDQLPNIIGSPILSQYRVTIQNTAPRHVTVGGTTYRTPAVSLSSFSTSLPAGYSKLSLKVTDQGPPDSPYYLNFDFSGADDPTSPGGWTSLVTNGGVSLTRGSSSVSNQTFLFDSGAQLSLISNDTAANLGIFNASAANADFVVQVLGVGGLQDVPGYYLNNLTITTQGGPITLNRVPVLVLDVADPRDPTSPIPGILGTNLFGDRDLILNTNVDATGQIYVGIGPQWMWKTNGSGVWSANTNWSAALPNGIDTQANFYGAITSAATVTVDSNMTVGSIAFDNANRYTLAGPGSIIMQVSVDQAQINVLSGSHTIAAPMVLASDTNVSVVQSSSVLTISGNISSLGTTGLTKSGAGTLLLSGNNTYTGATTLLRGAIELGAAARQPIFTGGGADIQNGKMVFDYTSVADDPAATINSLLKAANASHFASGQFRSSTLEAGHALGWNENAASSQVIVDYTWLGDVNLDGKVDIGDLGILATHWQKAGSWAQGDFDYSGKIDIGDLGELATNWQAGVANPSALTFQQALAEFDLTGVTVPEPTVATLGLLMLCHRRRRA